MTAAPETISVDEKAIEWIAKNEYFSFLGEKKIREVAQATERVLREYGVDLFNQGRWMNPALRKEILKVLSPDLKSISETYAWMVARRYRELKRYYKEKAELEIKRKADEEAKAKLAAEKAAKAAAAKAKAPVAPGPGTQPASGTSEPAPSDTKKDSPGPS